MGRLSNRYSLQRIMKFGAPGLVIVSVDGIAVLWSEKSDEAEYDEKYYDQGYD